MDINIILWIGGMLFSLSIFAIKVGLGLGFGRIRWRGVLLTLSLYLLIFVLIAILSERLVRILEPVLKEGPYLHAIMAMGMVAWGIYTLRTQNTEHRTQIDHSSLIFLIPCPVCVTAMTFSTWAALNVIKLPAPIVGLGLGISFGALSLLICISLKLVTHYSSLITSRIGLGLCMVGIGLYFLASLYLPAKIEEAKGVYRSFLIEGKGISLNDGIGVFILLFVAMMIGYFANKRQEVKGGVSGKLRDFSRHRR